MITRIKILIFLLIFSPIIYADQLQKIENILGSSDKKIDLGHAKLLIDHELYPEIDVEKNLQKINKIISTIKNLPEYGNSQLEKMGSILRYLYTPGPWNNYQAYRYDFSGPMGAGKSKNETIANYIETKQGNCVSMPIFVAILGQRLGIDVYLSIAPRHVFVRYHDKKDGVINIETTSGTLLSDQRYIKAFNILTDAITNGIYLKELTNKESVAIMLNPLGRKYMREHRYTEAQQLADLMLKYYPKFVNAMLLKGNLYYLKLKRTLHQLESNKIPLTPEIRKELDPLYKQNLEWFTKAEKLGWKQPPENFNEKYLENIKSFRSP